ncbi:glycine betaine ABC transporter substrate-binding protein [Oceanidesulfovibrio marinus]|uniref:Glycine betaine ABC transporter substrate-binding protein n=1 Tax=Oceanidesulfovibrio marinus TaxID=370038 RepID=A0A6P1ZJF1_9BACT|nr:glycine betaine ABC transporter substrate-binding protein [Oceanidesulfovibrio marinus]QJT10252.1 glycine betaine ABC transporter substrate-binding protein [Oceanidesulfovibrio marinus]TVM35676.1 glycine/betaine ABC transporter substrate-binding protein [Oceanidesulfovibrio marinus]
MKLTHYAKILLAASLMTLLTVSFAWAQKVELAYVEWSSEVASTNVVKAVLEDKLGAEVEIIPVSVGPMYAAVAAGDVDGMVASWQPLQAANLEAVQADVVDLGPNMVGVQSGLVVPAYVTIDSIDQLEENADKFDNEIIGIDPGAGIMQQTEKVMKEYGLKDLDLIDSTGAMMTASLADAMRNEEWVVVTGWTPHWMWGTWDLKYLKDPKNIYGKAEDGTILTLVRKGLQEDMPKVYAFLDKFNWGPDDMAKVMVWIRDGMEPEKAARKFIDENPDLVNSWLQ